MADIALITGASSGIGKALTHRFAKNGYDVIMVASEAEMLEKAADEVRSGSGVEVKTIVKDLTAMEAPQELYDEVKRMGVQVLVNNAGVGYRSPLAEIPLEKMDEIIHLDVRAFAVLTRLFLADMLARGSGRILQVGSIAGFQPGPLMATYHASKAFVVSFCEAVIEEIRDSSVTMTVLCPGPVNTPFFERANAGDAKAHDPRLLMEPEEVAEAGYKGLMDGEHVVIPGMSNKVLNFSRRLMSKEMQAKLNKKSYESSEE